MSSVAIRIADYMASFRHDPLACAKFAFPWGETGPLQEFAGPREWQADVMREIKEHLSGPDWAKPLQIAIASGHGIGKTALIAMLSHWAMSTCADTRVMVTANTEDQLTTKTWPEISKWFSMAINSDWWIKTATRIVSAQNGHEDSWRLDRVTWSENNTEAFQGLHNLRKRIVVIFEEASGIPPKIWQVTQGALTDENTEIIWLAFGNPTQNTGDFRECFGRMSHRWSTRHIDSRTVPGTNQALMEQWVNDYGEDSDFVRVRVRGEFPRAGSSQFIAQDIAAAARVRHVEPSGWPVISVDVARFGSNQTVILLRQGGRARILERGRGWDTQQTAMRVEHHIMEQNARACIVDGDGIGGAVTDKIRLDLPKPNTPVREWPDTQLTRWFKSHTAFQLQEFHGASPPFDPFMYRNKRAECWGLMREWLKTGEIPDDPEFEQDLTGVEYWYTDKFTIQLERKEDMEERGLASPDNGDALAMSFAAFPAAETRDEKLLKEQAAIKDPMALHFAKLAETERRTKAKQGPNWWD